MNLISTEDLFEYFISRNNRFRNFRGMELGLTEGNELWTYFSLCNHDRGPLAISISTEEDGPLEFIEGFKIASFEDIQALDYTNAWMRYLNGEAEISVTPFDLEATLGFKIVDLHFYDEVYEHLTMAEDFEGYLSTHRNRLNSAGENRFRLNRK